MAGGERAAAEAPAAKRAFIKTALAKPPAEGPISL
jgi:hypothetical protein